MIPNNYMAQTRSQTTNQLSFLVFSCSFLTSNQSNEWRTMKHQTRGNSPNTLIWWSHSSHFSTHTPFTSVHYMKTHTHTNTIVTMFIFSWTHLKQINHYHILYDWHGWRMGERTYIICPMIYCIIYHIIWYLININIHINLNIISVSNTLSTCPSLIGSNVPYFHSTNFQTFSPSKDEEEFLEQFEVEMGTWKDYYCHGIWMDIDNHPWQYPIVPRYTS